MERNREPYTLVDYIYWAFMLLLGLILVYTW